MLTAEQQRNVETNIGVAHLAVRKARETPLAAYMSYDDMLSAALLGLCAAARTFDPDKGVWFNHYAKRRCYGAIIDDARALDSQRTLRSRTDRARGRPSAVAFSLDEEFATAGPGEDRHINYHQVVGDDRTITHEQVADADDVRYLHEMIDRLLTDREATFIRLYYLQDWKMHELGEVFGITESRVSQVLTKARNKLRLNLK